MRPKQLFAHKLAVRIALKHDLSYKTRVTLEQTINFLFMHGLTRKQGERAVTDLFKNLYFINHAPMLPLPVK